MFCKLLPYFLSMTLWFFYIVGLNILSWGTFFLVHKHISHVLRSQIHILGEENIGLVKTSSLLIVRWGYFLFTCGLTVASFFIFSAEI